LDNLIFCQNVSQLKFYLRIKLSKAHYQWRDQQRGRRGNKPNSQCRDLAKGRAPGAPKSPLGSRHQFPGFLKKNLSCGSEQRLSMVPEKQLNADFFFEVADLHAESRLTQMDGFGGASEM
jgi:hypothetical protein